MIEKIKDFFIGIYAIIGILLALAAGSFYWFMRIAIVIFLLVLVFKSLGLLMTIFILILLIIFFRDDD
jgi:hypothetical protein